MNTIRSSEASPRRGALALSLQEALTVTVRLRADRQIAADAGSFRQHIKQLLAAADRKAREAGYDGQNVKLAVYAFVAFLDESVLSSTHSMFAEWHRRPMQEEIFGDMLAGEVFFQNLRDLLARQDSEDLADLLEVYQLCMLLGFKGRYAAGDGGELGALMATVQDKVMRIRGGAEPVAASWALPEGEEVQVRQDTWLKPMRVLAGAALLLTVLLWAGCSVALNRKVRRLEAEAESVQTSWTDTAEIVVAPATPG
jgi:type VI secretion system protein ImpK